MRIRIQNLNPGFANWLADSIESCKLTIHDVIFKGMIICGYKSKSVCIPRTKSRDRSGDRRYKEQYYWNYEFAITCAIERESNSEAEPSIDMAIVLEESS